MKQFKEAYKIIEDNQVIEEFNRLNEYHYLIKEYPFKLYLKVSTWFCQCGCRVGVLSKPTALCKHHIAFIVYNFLKVNNLKVVKNE